MSKQNEIIVVSGLPRSGTSLMMQMLCQGGIEPLCDQIREADADNPKGYLEFERVKKIKVDKAWLPDARGKAVKMISQLLYDLPDTETYKVIFMRRDLDEVISSQEAMLVRRGSPVPNRLQIAAAFTTHLDRLFNWLPDQKRICLLEIKYNDLFTDPERSVQKIADFLPNLLDAEKMLTAIDPALYRNRESIGSSHSQGTRNRTGDS